MERSFTLGALAAPEGVGQWLGAALRRDEDPPTLASLAAPQGAGQWLGAALRY
jgi:hypothetical protein